MTREEAIRIISGEVLGTTEQTLEAVVMAVEALKRTDKRKKRTSAIISADRRRLVRLYLE